MVVSEDRQDPEAIDDAALDRVQGGAAITSIGVGVQGAPTGGRPGAPMGGGGRPVNPVTVAVMASGTAAGGSDDSPTP